MKDRRRVQSFVFFWLLISSLEPTDAFVPRCTKVQGDSLYLRNDEQETGASNDDAALETTDGYKKVPNILNPSRKQQVIKRKQGEAASASMDLPSQPVVTTFDGGANLLFRMVRQQTAPRWHPNTSSSNQPKAYAPPVAPLEARAAAVTIWKNARKRNKPSLWRYAIRTFERLSEAQTTNVHYEGALVAAAKLGWSEKAFAMYRIVQQRHDTTNSVVRVTDNMMLSLVKACVRDALTTQDRSILDTVVSQVLRSDDSTTAAHWNPVASAYRKLGCHETAREILASLPAPHERFNVQDVHAKDAASYAIAVSTSVADGDFGQAVGDLRAMTELGLYPKGRHLGEWAELSGQ